MLPLLAVVFVVVPIVEIYVLIRVGMWIGPWWTIALLLADGFAGAWLFKSQGRRTWTAFTDALRAGRFPGREVASGALVIVGGTLLLAPGFVTDVFGALLLVPPTRAIAERVLVRILRRRFGVDDLRAADPRVIDGTVTGPDG